MCRQLKIFLGKYIYICVTCSLALVSKLTSRTIEEKKKKKKEKMETAEIEYSFSA